MKLKRVPSYEHPVRVRNYKIKFYASILFLLNPQVISLFFCRRTAALALSICASNTALALLTRIVSIKSMKTMSFENGLLFPTEEKIDIGMSTHILILSMLMQCTQVGCQKR
jgi:hypothetical protein